MTQHTILFLAANPSETERLALDREARAIQGELERSGHRDQFALVTRWAAEPLDLLRELRKLRPTVVHFSGHGHGGITTRYADERARRDISGTWAPPEETLQDGLVFDTAQGGAQLVSAAAIEHTLGAAGASVKVVVLSACYSAPQAEALLAHVDCVVGMQGPCRDDVARHFAVGFYGGLGERESVAAAFHQGRAAIRLAGLGDGDQLQLRVRPGVNADQIFLLPVPAQAITGADSSLDRVGGGSVDPGTPSGGQGADTGLRTAVDRAVPAMRYVVGMAGVAAVLSLIMIGLRCGSTTGALGGLIVFAPMVVLLVFARLARTNHRWRALTFYMTWGCTVLAFGVTMLFGSCFFFEVPISISCLMQGECERRLQEPDGLDRRPPAQQGRAHEAADPACRLLQIDDVIARSEESRSVLDIRVRNSGRGVVNITRADVHVLRKMTSDAQISCSSSADYDVLITDEHNIVSVSHVIHENEVDRFVLHLGIHCPCILETEIILTYNGHCSSIFSPVRLIHH